MIMAWTGAHSAFAVGKFFFKTECLMATQITFHAYFMLYQNDAVLDRKLILLWVENFRSTGLLIEKKATWKN